MLAQRRYEVVTPVATRTRKGKKTSYVRALARNRMVCVLAVAAVVSVLLSAYVGAYARFTEKGYHRSVLLADLSKLKKENQVLRLQAEGLQQPGRIEAFARTNGMKPGQKTAYLGPVNPPHVAQNTVRGEAE